MLNYTARNDFEQGMVDNHNELEKFTAQSRKQRVEMVSQALAVVVDGQANGSLLIDYLEGLLNDKEAFTNGKEERRTYRRSIQLITANYYYSSMSGQWIRGLFVEYNNKDQSYHVTIRQLKSDETINDKGEPVKRPVDDDVDDVPTVENDEQDLSATVAKLERANDDLGVELADAVTSNSIALAERDATIAERDATIDELLAKLERVEKEQSILISMINTTGTRITQLREVAKTMVG